MHVQHTGTSQCHVIRTFFTSAHSKVNNKEQQQRNATLNCKLWIFYETFVSVRKQAQSKSWRDNNKKCNWSDYRTISRSRSHSLCVCEFGKILREKQTKFPWEFEQLAEAISKQIKPNWIEFNKNSATSKKLTDADCHKSAYVWQWTRVVLRFFDSILTKSWKTLIYTLLIFTHPTRTSLANRLYEFNGQKCFFIQFFWCFLFFLIGGI